MKKENYWDWGEAQYGGPLPRHLRRLQDHSTVYRNSASPNSPKKLLDPFPAQTQEGVSYAKVAAKSTKSTSIKDALKKDDF